MFTRRTVEVAQSLLLELMGYLGTRKDQCGIDRTTTNTLRSWLLAQTGKALVEPIHQTTRERELAVAQPSRPHPDSRLTTQPLRPSFKELPTR